MLAPLGEGRLLAPQNTLALKMDLSKPRYKDFISIMQMSGILSSPERNGQGWPDLACSPYPVPRPLPAPNPQAPRKALGCFISLCYSLLLSLPAFLFLPERKKKNVPQGPPAEALAEPGLPTATKSPLLREGVGKGCSRGPASTRCGQWRVGPQPQGSLLPPTPAPRGPSALSSSQSQPGNRPLSLLGTTGNFLEPPALELEPQHLERSVSSCGLKGRANQ